VNTVKVTSETLTTAQAATDPKQGWLYGGAGVIGGTTEEEVCAFVRQELGIDTAFSLHAVRLGPEDARTPGDEEADWSVS